MPLPAESAVTEIIAVGRRLDARGLAAATSGNYSLRVSDDRIAITVSGSHKGRLRAADVMLVDGEGRSLDNRTPSAETPLHVQLYGLYPHVQAILHVHSVAAVALTRWWPEATLLPLEGYEMLKALPGITTHEARVNIPVFDNSQNIPALARSIAARLADGPPPPGYLIRGHGMNAWGRSLDEAERVLEALEYLLACELQTQQLRSTKRPEDGHDSLDHLSRSSAADA
jgi:methylthioribulose-1-phosphate dehydratase